MSNPASLAPQRRPRRPLSEPTLRPGPDLGDLAQLLAHPRQVVAVDADQEQALSWRAIVADAALVHVGARDVADGDVVGEIAAVQASQRVERHPMEWAVRHDDEMLGPFERVRERRDQLLAEGVETGIGAALPARQHGRGLLNRDLRHALKLEVQAVERRLQVGQAPEDAQVEGAPPTYERDQPVADGVPTRRAAADKRLAVDRRQFGAQRVDAADQDPDVAAALGLPGDVLAGRPLAQDQMGRLMKQGGHLLP